MQKRFEQTLDWDVLQMAVHTQYGREIKGFKALVNNESGETLQIVSDSYQPVKNAQLVECAQQVSERAGLTLEGYASFKGGRKVLAYLRDPEARSLGGSRTSDWMIIGNSHDKSTAFFTGHTSFVNRCENMFTNMNMQNRVHHSLGMKERIDNLMFATDLYFNAKTGMYEEMQSFEDVRMLPQYKDDFAKHVLRIPEYSGAMPTRTQNRVDEMMECVEIEANDTGNNLLALFNGATRYSSNRFQQKETVFGNPFGRVNAMNRDAFGFCKEKKAERVHLYLN